MTFCCCKLEMQVAQFEAGERAIPFLACVPAHDFGGTLLTQETMRFLVVFAAFLALAFARAVPKTTQSTTQAPTTTATSAQTTSAQTGLSNIEKFLLGVLDGYVEKKYGDTNSDSRREPYLCIR